MAMAGHGETLEEAPPRAADRPTSGMGEETSRTPRQHGVWYWIAVIIVCGATIGAIGVLLLFPNPSPSSTSVSRAGLILDFGLGRDTITRSLRVDLCASADADQFRECPDGTEEGETRPDIVAALLESDLRREGGGSPFPAGQILISASNEGRTAVLLNVSADPNSPDDVPAGKFEGRLIVERNEGPEIEVPVTVTLENRGGPVTGKALLALGLGAVAGTLLKWLDESFGPLASLRRRQRRVEHLLKRSTLGLPQGVNRRLEDIRDAIKNFDPEGIATSLGEIVNNQDALLEFAGGIERLEREVASQERLARHKGVDAWTIVVGAVAVEKQSIAELRDKVWPWERAEEVKAVLTATKDGVRQLSEMLRRFSVTKSDNDRHSLERLAAAMVDAGPDHLQRQDLEKLQGVSMGGGTEARPSAASDDLFRDIDATSEHGMDRYKDERRTVRFWLLDNAWWITLVIVAAIVVAFGYQTQFLENNGFEGDRLDYFTLGAWAFAIQVAGGSVIETVGRLRVSRAVTA